jgi:hypothetical protein
MVRALCQGAAVVCKPYQRDDDSIIVFLLDRDKGFTKGNLGRILVQDKNPVLAPAKLPGGNVFPTISFLHQPAQSRHIVAREPPKKKKATATPPPIYAIDVEGTHLLSNEDVQELLMADSPLVSHRRGSELAAKSHSIVEHNRYYTVSEEPPMDAFDQNITYVHTGLSPH